MNTGTTWQINSTSSDETEALGRKLGARLRGGEVIELTSDLGGGKTTFVRGLAAGMGSKDHVSSPSFTISQVYNAGNLTLHHYDFYRLPEAGLMAPELAEVIADPQNVVVVEWAGVVEDVLPNDRLTIAIETTGEQTRTFHFTVAEKYDYLREKE
jgi:tRNA threonylcarbamoyladenosine biosynthesis protein TsaE